MEIVATSPGDEDLGLGRLRGIGRQRFGLHVHVIDTAAIAAEQDGSAQVGWGWGGSQVQEKRNSGAGSATPPSSTDVA